MAVVIIILILAILLVIFTLQNSIEISINAFFWQINDAPLVLVLIVCIVVGYLFGALYLYPQLWRLRKENKRLKRAKSELEEQAGKSYAELTETDPEGIDLTEIDDEDDENEKTFFGD